MSTLSKLAKLADPDIRRKNLEAARLRGREAWFGLRRPSMPDPVFVIGCSRSGTTVTFETLAASNRFLHFEFEIPRLWNGLYGPLNNGWASEAAGPGNAHASHRRKALAFFYARLGCGSVLEKTCINTMRVGYLHALFPKARFIFIHRDGRDNVSSMMDGWRLGRADGGFGLTQFFGPSPDPVAINGGEFSEWHFFLPPGWRAYNAASLEEVCAFQWESANRLALDALRRIPENLWIRVRYEDIFEDPVGMFRRVFDYLSVSFDQGLRDRCEAIAAKPTSVVRGKPKKQKWKESNPQAVERILPRIAPMMQELGYDVDD